MLYDSNKFQKSPLRYPGGKSRAVEIVLDLIPEGSSKLISPFCGGGSIELACASIGMNVEAYDIFQPLVNFWVSLLEKPKQLIREVKKYHPLTKERFSELQEKQKDIKSPLKSGAIFFVLNRSSFSGSTLSGGMSPDHPRFNQSCIDRLKSFAVNNFQIEHASFENVLSQPTETLIYCDPPYCLEAKKNKLYGYRGDMHQNFAHQKLHDLLTQNTNWILSYNECDEIKELYKNYHFVYPEWKYGMSKDKKSKEVIIVSDSIGKKLKDVDRKN